MLTWDEEVTPALQTPLSSSLPDSHVAQIPPALTMPATPALDAVAAPGKAKRVKASDKRIINGQTDVNQLVPF